MKEYITIRKENTFELIEKKSRFIGRIYPINSIEEAEKLLKEIKKKYFDARHNVYAYKLGDIEKCSDDGEPQGTGGQPILSVIKKKDINNCIIIVTRYFGGVLLGAPGLVRAYSNCAVGVIETAELIKIQLYSVYSATCSYSQYEKIQSKVKIIDAEITDVKYCENVQFKMIINTKYDNWVEENFINSYNIFIFLQKENEIFK